MGADLCGYIMVGPKKIPKRLEKEAIKKALKELNTEGAIQQTREAEDPRCYVTISLQEEKEEKEQPTQEEVEDAVRSFVKMWNGGGYRDVMERRLPGTSRKIVVCGERTWGDGPDPNSAWGVTDRAAELGVFDILGVE